MQYLECFAGVQGSGGETGGDGSIGLKWNALSCQANTLKEICMRGLYLYSEAVHQQKGYPDDYLSNAGSRVDACFDFLLANCLAWRCNQ